MDWLKKLLEGKGLLDEQVKAIVDGVESNYKGYVPKHRFDEVNEAKGQLEQDLKDRDTQLADLKKNVGDNAELKKQIEDLQSENKTKDEEYQTKMKELSLNAALKLSLANDVHDSDLVLSLIDKEKIELADDGSIKGGLDDQVKSLRESKTFLFVEKQGDKPPAFKGFTPTDGKGADDKGGKDHDDGNFGKQLAEFSKNSSGGLEQARNSYFE